MNSQSGKATVHIGIFEISILILSLVLLCALAADTLLELTLEVRGVIQAADTVIRMVLLLDFFVRLYRAESKLGFMNGDGFDPSRVFPTWICCAGVGWYACSASSACLEEFARCIEFSSFSSKTGWRVGRFH